MKIARVIPLVCCLAVGAFAGEDNATPKPIESPTRETTLQDSGRAGIGFKVGMTGIGFEGAARVTHRTNVRAGFSFLNYKRDFTANNGDVSLKGQFAMRAIDLHYDIFPRAGRFHVSPGLLMFMGNPVSANVSATGFTLNHNDYTSDPSNPVHGSIKLNWRKASPMFTVGTGNLVSRKEGKHFTVPFEAGLAFTGAPRATYNVTGNVCQYSSTSSAEICGSKSLSAQFQQDLAANQAKVNSELQSYKMLKIYPIFSLGVGYKF